MIHTGISSRGRSRTFSRIHPFSPTLLIFRAAPAILRDLSAGVGLWP